MRSRRTLTLAVVAAVLVLGGVSHGIGLLHRQATRLVFALGLPGTTRPRPSLQWHTPPELPHSLMVYRLTAHTDVAARASEVAAALPLIGVSACKAFMFGELAVCRSADRCRSLSLGMDGALSLSTLQPVSGQPVSSCDEDIGARDGEFLRQHGLLRAWRSAPPSTDATATHYGGESTPLSYTYDAVAALGRVVDGLPVYGSWHLEVAEGEEPGKPLLLGLTGAWQSLEPYAELPLRTVEQAFDDARQGEGAVVVGPHRDAPAGWVSLAYYEPAAKGDQHYLQPVYLLALEGSADAYLMVPALAESAIVYPTPAPTATPVEAVVPDSPIRAARAIRDGRWQPIDQGETRTILAAARDCLRDTPNVVGLEGYYDERDWLSRSGPAGVTQAVRPDDAAMEVTYWRPVRFSMVVSSVWWEMIPYPYEGSRAVFPMQRFLVYEIDNHSLYFACAPKPGGRGHVWEFLLPPADASSESGLLLKRLLRGEPAAQQPVASASATLP